MSVDAGFVLVHGFTGDAGSWEAVLCGRNAAGLSVPGLSGSSCHTVELLGHGACASHASTWSEEMQRLLDELQEHRGATLVGYSLGARVALGLLVEAPQHFAGAVLIGGQPGLPEESERSARCEADERLAVLLEKDGILPFLERWEALPLFASQRRLAPALLERQRDRRRLQDPSGLARSLRVLGTGSMPDLWPRLAEIEAPVDLVVGGEDHKFLEIARRMQRALSAARLVVVEGVGHNVLLEAPEAVVEVLAGAARVRRSAGRRSADRRSRHRPSEPGTRA